MPTLGICRGHQLCAVALGGRVGRNPRGQQRGLVEVGWHCEAASDPLLGAVATARRGVHWNDDVVLDLPPGARVLATAPDGEVQAARYASSVWGVQLHPEVDERAVQPWAEMERDRYDAAHLASVLAQVARAQAELVDAWRPLGTALARLAGARPPGPEPAPSPVA